MVVANNRMPLVVVVLVMVVVVMVIMAKLGLSLVLESPLLFFRPTLLPPAAIIKSIVVLFTTGVEIRHGNREFLTPAVCRRPSHAFLLLYLSPKSPTGLNTIPRWLETPLFGCEL